MSVKLEMPKLSDTMQEGTLVRWLVKAGDEINIGDEVAEIETDKATMVMESFDEGILTDILIQEGQKAPIGATLAVLDGNGDTAPEAKPEPTSTQAPPQELNKQTNTPPPSSTTSNHNGTKRVKASPLARKIAAEKGLDLNTIIGSGPNGRILRKDLEEATVPTPQTVPEVKQPIPQKTTQAPLATPSIPATPAPPKPAPTPTATPAPAAITPTSKEGDTRIELSNMRKIIAERLLTSKVTIPHFYLHVEVDAAPLMTLRKQVNAQAEVTHGNKYSVNDFVLKAAINALLACPAVNASFSNDHIVQFGHIGISVAVAVDEGLVTPVIKNADKKSLLQISREVKDLAKRAKDNKLKPNEFDGGTLTVSNLGAWGIESFDAIINPPQAAILSVGAIVEKPVVKDGAVVPGLRMNIGVSGDHRVVDGAVGAEFLSQIKKLIESPALMLV